MINSSIMKLGDSNDGVLELNQILASKGFLKKEPDNKFDELTKQAVLLFQTKFKLTKDGIVGPFTNEVLHRIKDYITGIDVSAYQNNVDWVKVSKTDVKFAIARLNDGVKYKDSTFLKNWEQIKENGLIRGVYQFFRPEEDVNKQIDILFEKVSKLEPGDLPPILDVEVNKMHLNPQSLKAEIDIWIEAMTKTFNCTPIIYTAPYFWNQNIGHVDSYQNIPLWVATYFYKKPILPSAWTKWSIWQYGTRNLSGILNEVDANLFNGSMDDLKNLANYK